MVLKCLVCNYKCGNIACLKFHYESCHKDKIDKCICGNITISGICANDFTPWGCSLKNESSSSSGFGFDSNTSSNTSSNSSSSSNTSSNSNSNSNSKSNISSNTDSSSNTSSNTDSSSNTSSNTDSSSNTSSSSNNSSSYNSSSNPNSKSEVLVREQTLSVVNQAVPIMVTPMVKHLRSSSTDGQSPIHEVVTPIHEALTPIRNCNKCNQTKPLTDFDDSKYTCRKCTSTKVNCPYCTSIVRYDWIRAHVKKQHPGVELVKGFSRTLTEGLVKGPSALLHQPLHSYNNTQTEEICSCKYYNFVLFLINNGINIEKLKENINLLKSIDNFK